MAAAVVALVVAAGVNLNRTVVKLDIAMAETETDTVIARVDNNVPQDVSSFVAPLGENKVTGPDESKILAAAVGTQGMIIGLLAVCLVVVISLVVRYWRRDRNPGE